MVNEMVRAALCRSVCSITALAALVLIAISGSAIAGGPAGPLEDPFVVPPQQLAAPSGPAAMRDWSGFYGGLSLLHGNGSNHYYIKNTHDKGPLDLAGSGPGLFLGYNVQRGHLVFGGEVAASFGKIEGTTPGFDTQDILGVVDLKGRLGYATGPFLFYGALGYSFTRLTEDYVSDSTTLGGVGFGVGVDYRIGSKFFVGLEYYQRETNGDLSYAPYWSIRDAHLGTVSLRVGMTF